MRALVIATLLAAIVVPAQAAMNVVTSTLAHECYQHAIKPQGSGADICSRALANTKMSDSDKTATLVNRGIIYNAARQLKLAISDFDAALKIEPNFSEAYLNRGNSYFYQDKLDKALADYTKAIDLKVKEMDYAYFNRSLVHRKLKQFAAARADLQAALGANPQFKPAKDQLEVVNKIIAQNAAVDGASASDTNEGAPASNATPSKAPPPAAPANSKP